MEKLKQCVHCGYEWKTAKKRCGDCGNKLYNSKTDDYYPIIYLIITIVLLSLLYWAVAVTNKPYIR